MTFYVGQKVVFVCDRFVDGFGIKYPLVYGQIYTITALLVAPPGDLTPFGLTLYEVEAPWPYKGFAREMFRPAVERKTDISVFQKTLTEGTVMNELETTGGRREGF